MPVPDAPSGLTVTITGQRADLSWTRNDTTDIYSLIERKTGAGAWYSVDTIRGGLTKYWDYTVRPSETYTWRVKKGNNSGLSAASNEDSDSTGAASSPTGVLNVYNAPGTTTTTGFVDEVLLFDARLSTNCSRRRQEDGTPSVTIAFGDGETANLLASGHAYRDPGVYVATFNCKNASGAAATEVTQEITISEIPAATGGGIQHLTDQGNSTTNQTNLQAAINTAAAANSVEQEIHLDGNWTTVIKPVDIIAPTGGKYITIKWTGLTVPHKKRVYPADFTNAPTLVAVTATIEPAIATPASNPDPPSRFYRIIGLRFKRDNEIAGAGSGNGFLHVLTRFGSHDPGTTAKIPHHIIVQRCWFDGGTGNEIYSKDGMLANSDYFSVMDSYFAEFKRVSGPDPAAISTNVCQGPQSVRNNYLLGGGENYSVTSNGPTFSATISSPTNTSATLSNVGSLAVDQNIALPVGGVPDDFDSAYSTIVRSISGNNITFDPIANAPDNGGTARWDTINSFLEFRHNFVEYPNRWREFLVDGSPNPDWVGFTYNTKNLWEVKSGRYLLNDGNIFRRDWVDSQVYSIVIGSHTGGSTGWANVIREVQFSNNIFRDMTSGPAITGSDQDPTWLNQAYTDMTFSNNLFWNVGRAFDETGGAHPGWRVTSGAGSVTLPERIALVHNTWDSSNSGAAFFQSTEDAIYPGITYGDGGAVDSFFKNNIHRDGGSGYAVGGAGGGCGSSTNMEQNIKCFLPPGDTTTWNKNGIFGGNGHTYPASATVIDTSYSSQFVDNANGNFTLAGGHALEDDALDGTDVGVIVPTLQAAIGAPSAAFETDWDLIRVITGDWTGAPAEGVGSVMMGRVVITGVVTI